jgi:hypothetical protein
MLLEALYEAGMVGAIAVLLFLYYTARTAVRGLRLIQADNPQERLLVVGPLAMVLFLVLRGMASADLDGMRWFYLCCGLLYVNVSHIAYTRQQEGFAGSISSFESPQLLTPSPHRGAATY